jgi:archaellum biogenesis ATPase FlaH
MSSKLIITSVEKLQEKVEETIKSLEESIGIYVSLNKTQKSVEENLKKRKIKTDKIFFIDCVTETKVREDVLHVSPNDLEKLSFSIKSFNEKIKGEKYLIIDALSTLLIYNPENKVASFIKEISDLSSEKLKLIAISPKTKGEELLEKIFNFFEEVEK